MDARRKTHWLEIHHADYRRLCNQARFVQEFLDGKLVAATEKQLLLGQLHEKNYEPFVEANGEERWLSLAEVQIRKGGNKDEDCPGDGVVSYDYLLSIPFWCLTQEHLDELNARIKLEKEEYDALKALDENELWDRFLDEIITEWNAQVRRPTKDLTSTPETEHREIKKRKAGRAQRKHRGKDVVPSVKRPEDSSLKPETPKALADHEFLNAFTQSAKSEADEEGWDKVSDSDLDVDGANSKHLSKRADSPFELVSCDSKKPDSTTEVKGNMGLQDEGRFDGLDYDELEDEIDQSGKFIW